MSGKSDRLTAIMNARPDEKPWTETIGSPPRSLWVGERPQKKWTVYVRWQEAGAVKWMSLGYAIRDARGNVLARERKRALEEAGRMQADWKLGVSPSTARASQSAPAGSQAAQQGKGAATLREGFTLALHSSRGIFATDTAHSREWKRAAEDVMAALTDEQGPGGSKTWESITPHTAQTVWRHILQQKREEHLEHERDPSTPKPRGDGARQATKSVQCLYQVARWLHDLDPDRYPLRFPRKGWRNRLQEEWRQVWGHRPDEKEQPRFTPGELSLMLTKLHLADPRVALMVELGAEQRSGQAVRVTRRNILPGGGFGLGQIDMRAHGYGKKETTVLDIHPELSRRLRYEMEEGYMAELEQAFQKGDLEDYHLFPSGRLAQGRASLSTYLRKPGHLWQTSLVAMLHEYEKLLGIRPVEGRGFHGLRRLFADEAADQTTDTRTLRQITGWKNEETRQIYLRKLNEKAVTQAGEVMHSIRQKYRPGSAPRVESEPEE